jgi:hypothetical protein
MAAHRDLWWPTLAEKALSLDIGNPKGGVHLVAGHASIFGGLLAG